MSEIRLCACGCGQPTPIAPRTRRSKGWIKGQPLEFRSGHNLQLHRPKARLVPAGEPGYCQCGCGGRTPIATKTRRDRGQLRGQPKPLLLGHYLRKHSLKPKSKPAKKHGASGPLIPSRQLRCTECGDTFVEDTRAAVHQPRCRACIEKHTAMRRQNNSSTLLCSWCGKPAMATSGGTLKKKLAACFDCWDKLKHAMRAGVEGKEEMLSKSMRYLVEAELDPLPDAL